MRRSLQILFGLIAAGAVAEGAVTRDQLRAMARERVDAKVMRALVDRDCVDFDVDASNAAELSKEIPSEVIEAAIRCRQTSPKPAAQEPQPAATGSTGELRVRVQFIGEAGALSCACLLDQEPFATLSKPAQGEFGEAVPRTKIGKESAFSTVPAGPHKLLFRCDPHAQELSLDLEIPAGQRRTVEVKETTLRRWKLGKIDTK